MNILIKNLDAPLGAEIAGVDLSKPLSQDDVETIEETWRERLVVVFRGQRLSDPQLLAFSRNFGELDPPGPNPYGEPFNKEHPEINVISNVIENGQADRQSRRWRGRVACRHDVCRPAAQSRDATFP
jgi:taurine dioxygenase